MSGVCGIDCRTVGACGEWNDMPAYPCPVNDYRTVGSYVITGANGGK